MLCLSNTIAFKKQIHLREVSAARCCIFGCLPFPHNNTFYRIHIHCMYVAKSLAHHMAWFAGVSDVKLLLLATATPLRYATAAATTCVFLSQGVDIFAEVDTLTGAGTVLSQLVPTCPILSHSTSFLGIPQKVSHTPFSTTPCSAMLLHCYL